jgi:hypothetical protein
MSDIVQHITPSKAAELNMRGVIRDQADTIASLIADNKRLRTLVERIYQSSAEDHVIEIAEAALSGDKHD